MHKGIPDEVGMLVYIDLVMDSIASHNGIGTLFIAPPTHSAAEKVSVVCSGMIFSRSEVVVSLTL